MDSRTVVLPVQLPSGTTIQVEAINLLSEQDISSQILAFDGITSVIEEISANITEALSKARPTKANVEFGLQVAVEAGKLTALLVKGSGTATLKISLEWSTKL